MARQRVPVEVTSFAKGLLTEINPLSFPEDGSVDEVNFELTRDGTRRRRLGLDAEDSAVIHNTTVIPSGSRRVVFHSFDWENPGGLVDNRFAVVQSGNVLKFFDSTKQPVSGNLVYTYTMTSSQNAFCSIASIDGRLVVANGQKEILIFTYDGTTITPSTSILTIRDLFGVEDIELSTGADLFDGNNISTRPTGYTDAHTYNLRNQSFGVRRVDWTAIGGNYNDPIYNFYVNAGSKYPSNADGVFYNYYANPAAADYLERFHALGLVNSPPGSFPSPKGFLIIDAMERGVSRLAEVGKLDVPMYPISMLPTDKTPGGASCVAEFAGRVWYGGFSDEVIGGDNRSPRLGSYVLFSRIVESNSDITKCYQDGDPTSQDNPDVLPTDGGFIRISGARNILGLVPSATRIFVIAENGVWAVFGGDTAGFTATGYTVEKISGQGCVAKNSIIEVERGVCYWGEAGIFVLTGDEVQGFQEINITQPTIQTYYDEISAVDRRYCTAYFDASARKINWLFGNTLDTTAPVKELVYDINRTAFFPKEISPIANNRPMPVCYLKVPPYRIGDVVEEVTVGGVTVTASTVPVTVTLASYQEGLRDTMLVTLTADTIAGALQYTFATYSNRDFVDWEFFDGVGKDAAAYIVTGYATGGDTQREKGIIYLTFHMLRTEDGFEDIGGVLYPLHPSSCKLQTQWGWTNSANSNKWTPETQVYRYRRLYIPEDVNDPFDTGHALVTTKNKVRGRGLALVFKLSTEPKKDCRVLGWSFIADIESTA